MVQLKSLKKVIEICEESDLETFYYQDGQVTIQFSKHSSETRSSIDRDDKKLTIQYHSDSIQEENISELVVANETSMDNVITILSPFVGTIELSNKIKVNEGEIRIQKGDTICSIEAMKIYNDIKSPATGIVSEVLVENCAFVEFEQPLMRVLVDSDE